MADLEAHPEEGGPKPAGTGLEHYHEIMRAHNLSELEIRDGSLYVKLSRVTASAPVVAVPAASSVAVPPPAAAPKKAFPSITSPLAGVFYRAPSPSSPSFVKEGDKVAFGDVLCIIEAMKVMNEIRSDRPGIVHKILAENGKPVSAGQELFHIEPLSS